MKGEDGVIMWRRRKPMCRDMETGKECEDSRTPATAPEAGTQALTAGRKHLDFHPRAMGSHERVSNGEVV